MNLKELSDEILDLSEWADEYAETLPEEERTKLADICVYLRILQQILIQDNLKDFDQIVI